jgi:hypothetical protein
MKKTLIVCATILLVLVAQGQSHDYPDECLLPNLSDFMNLPDDLRVLVDDEKMELLLIQPKTNTERRLFETSYINPIDGVEMSTGLPLMFNNSQYVLLIRGTLWQTMTIQGDKQKVVKDNDTIFRPNFHLTNEGRLLYMEDSTRDFKLMDLLSGDEINFTFSGFINFIPYETESSSNTSIPLDYEFNPSMEYIAFLAYQDSTDTKNEVIRIQNLTDGAYFDISPETLDVKQIRSVFWSWYSDRFIWFSPEELTHEHIYDVVNQRILVTIDYPSDDSIRGSSNMSPNGKNIAYVYKTQTDLSPYILYVNNIENNNVRCFQLYNRPTNILDNLCDFCGDQITWTPNNRYIWWLECESELQFLSSCESTYKLMLIDVETNQYGALLQNVGINTRIGFIDS